MSNLNTLAGTYTLDASHSEVGFVARHAMVTRVRGAFTEFEGSASTGADLADARIELTVQAASVSTGSADRDAHLRSADFFDVETYPTIRFVSTGIVAATDDVLRVTGELTIKDFDLTWNAALETGGLLVSENVTLEFEVSAIKATDEAAVVSDEPAVSADEAIESTDEVTVEATPVTRVIDWVKRLFQPAAR